MMNRFVILIFILLITFPACSGQVREGQAKSGDAFLEPDNGYIILLGSRMDSFTLKWGAKYESLTLLAGGEVKTYESLRDPAISSNGHLVGINDPSKTVVYFHDEESPYKFTAAEGDNSINGGVGISNSGKRVYQIGVTPEDVDSVKRYAVQLVEFDTDHKRIVDRKTLWEYSAERFENDKVGIASSLSLPLKVSQNGKMVYFRSVEIDDDKRANGKISSGENPYDSPVDRLVGSNSYVYNRDDDNYQLCLGFADTGYSRLFQWDVSRNGRVTIFSGSNNGLGSLLVVKDPGNQPEKIPRDYEKGRIDYAQLSPEGSCVGYISGYSCTWNDVIIYSLISKRKDVLMRLVQVYHAAWSDDLKYVAYVSHRFKSSIKYRTKATELEQLDAWYLHLVNVETLEDTVIYVCYGEEQFYILDIVAESEEFEDKTKSKPRVSSQGEGKSGGAGDGFGKRKKKYGTAEGPSISSK